VLSLTSHAADAINGLVASSKMPPGSGLVISMSADSEQGIALELSLAEEPKQTDQLIQAQGANVFLESELAPYMDNKLLDVDLSGDEVSFLIDDQG
jgi:iron-sulfur cluster assembly protein